MASKSARRTKLIYDKLIEVAKAGRTISYRKIASLDGVGLYMTPYGQKEIRKILTAISKHEKEKGRPMLTAVVVREYDGIPGNGIFRIANELGYKGWKNRQSFYEQQLMEVYKRWNRMQEAK